MIAFPTTLQFGLAKIYQIFSLLSFVSLKIKHATSNCALTSFKRSEAVVGKPREQTALECKIVSKSPYNCWASGDCLLQQDVPNWKMGM